MQSWKYDPSLSPAAEDVKTESTTTPIKSGEFRSPEGVGGVGSQVSSSGPSTRRLTRGDSLSVTSSSLRAGVNELTASAALTLMKKSVIKVQSHLRFYLDNC